ncbi:MAG: HAD family hydrolase [Alphaproteobacteria bacterium]|nr:HAD family hydrolase [Alphaproteobacteria bacterium]
MKTLIIWDWNNTLVDTMDASFLAMQDVSSHYGVPRVSRNEMMTVIGTHRDYWQTTFGDKEEEAVHYYLKRYATYRHTIRVIDGAEDVLAFVRSKNIHQIILSNEDETLLFPETEYTNLKSYFDYVQGSVDEHAKPEIEFAQKALKHFDYEHLILIGDGVSDMQMADVLGATSICVFNNIPETIKTSYHCASLKDVKRVLERLLS